MTAETFSTDREPNIAMKEFIVFVVVVLKLLFSLALLFISLKRRKTLKKSGEKERLKNNVPLITLKFNSQY